jgi:hypothetical protein
VKLIGTFCNCYWASANIYSHYISFTNLYGLSIYNASELNADVDTFIQNYYITEGKRDLDTNIFVPGTTQTKYKLLENSVRFDRPRGKSNVNAYIRKNFQVMNFVDTWR